MGAGRDLLCLKPVGFFVLELITVLLRVTSDIIHVRCTLNNHYLLNVICIAKSMR